MSVVSSSKLLSVFRFSDRQMIQSVMNPHWIVSTLCQTREAFDNIYLNFSLSLWLDRHTVDAWSAFSSKRLAGVWKEASGVGWVQGSGWVWFNMSTVSSISLTTCGWTQESLVSLGRGNWTVGNEARGLALMLCWSHLAAQAFRWGAREHCEDVLSKRKWCAGNRETFKPKQLGNIWHQFCIFF